jgi:hypothetical protein
MYQKFNITLETPKVQGEVQVTVTDASHAHICTRRENGVFQVLNYRNDAYYFSLHVYKVGNEWVTKNPEDNRDYSNASRGHFRDASPTALETLKAHALAAFTDEIKKRPELLALAQTEANAMARERLQEKIREKKAELAELEKQLAEVGA